MNKTEQKQIETDPPFFLLVSCFSSFFMLLVASGYLIESMLTWIACWMSFLIALISSIQSSSCFRISLEKEIEKKRDFNSYEYFLLTCISPNETSNVRECWNGFHAPPAYWEKMNGKKRMRWEKRRVKKGKRKLKERENMKEMKNKKRGGKKREREES